MPTVERVRTAEIVFLVGVGGFAGASLRHVVSLTVPGLGGTFAVNIAGCLMLGALAYEAELAGFVAEETHYAAATGFCSSFTTYSTFALELVRSPALVGAGYAVSTYAVGFAAVLVGRRAVRTLTGSVES